MLDAQLPTQEPEPPKPMKGDLNSDAMVTLEDAQLALKLALHINSPKEEQIKAGDVNQDGTIGLEDAQQVLKAALKIITLS